MQQQHSMFDIPQLAGILPSIRAAMNMVAGADEDGRKLLVDKINALAASSGVRLTSGPAKGISKDTLDKWLAPADREHTPSIMALAVFCAATGKSEPLRALLRGLGLDLMTPEDRRLRDYGKACATEREARKRKRKLEEQI